MYNCQARVKGLIRNTQPLAVNELDQARNYWLRVAQSTCFGPEIEALKKKADLSRSSSLLTLRPFLDDEQLLRVGGRQQNSQMKYDTQHPVILHRSHPISKLLIRDEHIAYYMLYLYWLQHH